jgi:archaellum component FlaG (FlaF/FlaG flagellin family)
MSAKFYLAIICLLIAFHLSGQNITQQTIQWNSPSWFDPSTGSNVQEVTSVISSPTNITWKYAGNSIKYDMTIRGTNGSWNNVSNNGSITIQADAGNDSAVIEFKKTSERTLIRIVLAKPEETLIYVLDVTNTTAP